MILDTERNRAKKYAPPAGIKADDVNHFDFMHVPFAPPFGSVDFLDAIKQQRALKPSCIIVDSLSDEHEGPGGLLDVHDQNEGRLGPAAWLKPKEDRRELINGLMQLMVPVIFCFRAREKTKPIKDEKGKQVPTNVGWSPIAPPEIVHLMDLFALLPIKSDGVPMWKGATAYEDFSIKLPLAFRALFPDNKAIDAEMGRAMSVWALGDAKVEIARAEERPTKPASAPAAEAGQDSKVSATDASGNSAEETSSQEQPSEPSDAGAEDEHGRAEPSPPTTSDASPDPADVFPGDRKPADAPQADGPLFHVEQDQPAQATTAGPASGGFVDFAASVAAARDWPEIKKAVQTLALSEEYQQAARAQQSMARRIAFSRLKELTDGGYKFDFVTDLSAWRCYLEWESNLDALRGNRDAVANSAAWKALDRLPDDAGTKSKITLDRAYAARVQEIEAASASAEYA